jgi:MoxR-like ATPase
MVNYQTEFVVFYLQAHRRINMGKYPFDLIKPEYDNGEKQLADDSWTASRPIIRFTDNLEKGAEYFIPGEGLLTAINTSIAVGEPLLLTGEPGTGKTQVAYYVSYKLNLEKLCHFQVKSTSKAQDLLYTFDSIRYFRDANLQKNDNPLNKREYITEGPLWEALESDKPRVLLIDEIDKAPRDFPNDLLMELDQNEFPVPELGKDFKIKAGQNNRPIIIITSNSERRLPEPFLRRCIYHYIKFDESLLKKAINARKDEYPELDDEFLQLAIVSFIELRKQNLRKKPSTGELLTWVRIMAAASGVDPERLKGDLSELPYLGTLLKDRGDLEEIRKR